MLIAFSKFVLAIAVFCVVSYVVYQLSSNLPNDATAFVSSSFSFVLRFNLVIAAPMFSVLPLITVVISAAFTHLSVNHLVMLSAVAVRVISVDANVESIVVGAVHLSSPYT